MKNYIKLSFTIITFRNKAVKYKNHPSAHLIYSILDIILYHHEWSLVIYFEIYCFGAGILDKSTDSG